MKDLLKQARDALATCSTYAYQEKLADGDFWRWAHFNEAKVNAAIAALDAALAVVDQGREEWLKEAERRIAELAELRGQLPHTAWQNKMSHLITQRKIELSAHLRTVPAQSGYVSAPVEPTAAQEVKP